MIFAGAELGIWLLAASTLIAAIIGAGGAIFAALIARENRRKLTTPGDGTGTIGQQVEDMRHG